MKVLVTGADGFLGWHLQTRLHARGYNDVVAAGFPQWQSIGELMDGVDAIIHLAGVNDHQNEAANVELAEHLIAAAAACERFPRIVFSNTVHADTDTPYGRGKRRAAEAFATAAAERGSTFVDVRLPNLFGEHARPNYNTFTATFIDVILTGREPQIADRDIALLHVQDAAQALIDGLEVELEDGASTRLLPEGTPTTVQTVFNTLARFHAIYAPDGELPEVTNKLEVDLFNSLRAAMFADHTPMNFTMHTDPRGSFVELVRLQGGGGQTSFSTTHPGITRGNHYHLRKLERFVVLSGQARISLRKAFTDEIVHFDVSGDRPQAVDMPTGWSHSITNTGDETLTTLFWINELYDPADPDTFPMLVETERQR